MTYGLSLKRHFTNLVLLCSTICISGFYAVPTLAAPNCVHESYVELKTGEQSVAISVGKATAYKHRVGGNQGTMHSFVDLPFSQNYRIQVYLPASYGNGKRYPVVYMNDGERMFFGNDSWHVGSTIDRLAATGDEQIVVAIQAGPKRQYNYSHGPHWNEHGDELAGGGVKAYSDFLANKLKPFIDANYLTQAGRESTTIVGSSQGGLAAFYIGMAKRKVFGNAVVLSPSFWWGLGDEAQAVIKDVDSILLHPDVKSALKDAKNLPNVWMDWGTRESLSVEANDASRYLQAIYQRAGQSRRLVTRADSLAQHNEQSWAARFRLALEDLTNR